MVYIQLILPLFPLWNFSLFGQFHCPTSEYPFFLWRRSLLTTFGGVPIGVTSITFLGFGFLTSRNIFLFWARFKNFSFLLFSSLIRLCYFSPSWALKVVQSSRFNGYFLWWFAKMLKFFYVFSIDRAIYVIYVF